MGTKNKQLRITNDELKEKLDLAENEYVEKIDVWFDNIMKEWVIDATISQSEALGGKG